MPRHTNTRLAIFSRTVETAATVIFLDTFTGTNGTELNSHNPDQNDGPGTTYTKVLITNPSGTNKWEVQSNKASFALGTGGARAYIIDMGVSDIRLDFVMNFPATGGGHGIAFRATDASNYFGASLEENTDQLRIDEETSGSLVLRATAAKTIDTGVDYDCILTLDGTSMELNVGGTTVSYTSSVRQTVTNHGGPLNLGATNGVTFDTLTGYSV